MAQYLAYKEYFGAAPIKRAGPPLPATDTLGFQELATPKNYMNAGLRKEIWGLPPAGKKFEDLDESEMDAFLE